MVQIARAAMATLLMAAPLSFGQGQEDDESIYELETVTVSGYRSALAQSIEDKRNARQVVDTISAEEVGQFPDQNVAEAIQRITGIAMTRNNGEGEKVSVRGLAPNFTRVEVDGRSSMVTADDSSPERDAYLSVYSSDLYQSIEVIKSPTAADVEGGVGGTVRLKTPDPLSLPPRTWGAELSYLDSDVKDSAEPGLNFFYSDVFAEGKAGYLISGTHEDRDRRVDKIQSNQDFRIVDEGFLADDTDPDLLGLVGAAFPGRTRYFVKAGDAPRTNMNAKFQMRPSESLEFYLNGLYTIEEREEMRTRIQMQWRRGELSGGSVDPNTNTLVQAQISRHRTDIQNFLRKADIESYGLTGGFKLTGEKWGLNVEASTASGEEDFDEIRADHRTNRDGLGTYDMTRNPKMPDMTTPAIEKDPNSIPLRRLDQQRRIIGYDEDYLKADLEYQAFVGIFSSFNFGVRLSNTDFERLQGRSSAPTEKPGGDDITFGDGNTSWVFGEGRSLGFGAGGPGFPSTWPSVDPEGLLMQYPLESPVTFDDEDVYMVDEETLAAYVMANFDANAGDSRIYGNIGVRVAQTDVGGEGRVTVSTSDEDIVLDEFPAFQQDYTEALPSFNIIYAPRSENSNWLVRGAISKALTRPTVNELRPSAQVDVDDAEISVGNTALEPFSAWQYDLGFERYFGEGGEGMFALAGFIKDVENFIVANETIESRAFPEAGVGEQMYLVESYANGGEADITGFEVSLQSPFTFLPGEFRNFGGMVNYTYIDSEFIDTFGNTNPFPGSSDHTYNIVGFYEKGGFSARLAYNFRDDYLIVPSSSADGRNNEFVEGGGRLDLGLRYRFKNGFKMSLDLLNITEEQQYIYYDVEDRLEDLTFEGMLVQFSVGVKY